VRTARDPLQIVPDVRAAVRQVNPNQPMADIKTLSRVVSDSVAQAGLYTVLLGCFAALALVLAAAGIFSVIAWTVNQSTHEIGIRMALGAAPRDILRTAMGQPFAGAAVGAVVGLGGAGLLTKLLASQLYGVTPTDPLIFAATPVVLLAVAWVAAYVPARRAARVDPMVALRSE
jgi:putative ABC transport system permease protein